MKLFLSLFGAIFILNIGVLAFLLCRLVCKQKETSYAMRSKNYPRRKFDSAQTVPDDPLESFKALQWNLVYYAMLLYGALYIVSGFNIFDEPMYKIILITAALAVFDFGIYLVVELQYKMQQLRIVRMRFETAFRLEHYWMNNKEIEDQKNKEYKFWRDARISVLLVVVQSFALIVFLYSLFDKIIFSKGAAS